MLDEFVPEYKRIAEELTNADPLCRPSAREALLKFRQLRESVREAVRFVPKDGYPEDISYLRQS